MIPYKVGDRFIYVKEAYSVNDDAWIFGHYKVGEEYFINTINWDNAQCYQLSSKYCELYWMTPYALENSFKPVPYRTIKVFNNE